MAAAAASAFLGILSKRVRLGQNSGYFRLLLHFRFLAWVSSTA
jgi:hypothetical protein